MAFIPTRTTAGMVLSFALIWAAGTAVSLETFRIDCVDPDGWRAETAYGVPGGRLLTGFADPGSGAMPDYYGVAADCGAGRSAILDVSGPQNLQARIDLGFYYEVLAQRVQTQDLDIIAKEFREAGIPTNLVDLNADACICQSEGDS